LALLVGVFPQTLRAARQENDRRWKIFIYFPILACGCKLLNHINSGYTGMMVRWEWSVGSDPRFVRECGIIDLDFIIPIQPETISDAKLRTA
jgi:hypothetical protein